MNHTQPEAADLLAAARRLGPLIRDRRDESERDRRLPAIVLSAMHQARLFRMYVPVEYGGLETDPITSMQVVEAVAEADAATAWNLMIGATYGIWAAFLPEVGAREIYSNTDAVVAGGLRPSGIAHAAAGGYRVSGRWAFASGIDHCAWWNGGCVVYEDGAPRPTERGTPQTVLFSSPPPAASGSTPGTPVGCAARVATIMQSVISSFLRSEPSPSTLHRACRACFTVCHARPCSTTQWLQFHLASPVLRSTP